MLLIKASLAEEFKNGKISKQEYLQRTKRVAKCIKTGRFVTDRKRQEYDLRSHNQKAKTPLKEVVLAESVLHHPELNVNN